MISGNYSLYRNPFIRFIMSKLINGVDAQDIKVTIPNTEIVIPKEFYSIKDSNVVLNQDGNQFVKTYAKQAYQNDKKS